MDVKRILVVDDMEFNVEFEEKVINSLVKELGIDMQVDTAMTVRDALDKIENNEPYDAMVIDMNLPDGSGTEIAKASRKKSEKTRLAALTIYPSRYEKERGFFDLYLKKPILSSSYKENFAHLLQI